MCSGDHTNTFFVVGMYYHQYDSMIYPEVINKLVAFKKGTVTSVAKLNAEENEFLVLDRESMQKEALYLYLNYFKTKLCSFELSADCNIEYLTNEILRIYWALSNTLVGASQEKFKGTWRRTWPCKELYSVSLDCTIIRVLMW